MTPILITVAAFLGVAALVGWLAMSFRGDSENKVEDRLELLTTAKSAAEKGPSAVELLTRPLDAMPNLIENFLARWCNPRLFLEQADVSFTTEKFFMVCGGMAFGGAAICIVGGIGWAVAPLAAIIAGTLPMVWILMRRKRRFKKFNVQLPDALELIGRALRAGHSLASGFNLVGTEMAAPISVEFNRVFEEQNLGIPLEEALQNMTERMPNLDLQFFATAVVLQRQTGGDLAEILDKIGRLVRERFKIWGQVQALTGEGRLSGIVLLALPPSLALVVYRLNPEYLQLLFTDELGKKMLIVAIVLQFVGAIAIRKIVNIKV